MSLILLIVKKSKSATSNQQRVLFLLFHNIKQLFLSIITVPRSRNKSGGISSLIIRFPVECKLEGLKLSSEPILFVKAVKFIANTIIHFMSSKSSKKE